MERRLLVVEDDQQTREHVSKSFEQVGWTVETSDNGVIGLQHALSKKFDLIILDRSLPGLDGLSALKAMRAAEVKTPVLILSALAHLDERVKGLRAGGDDYLVKPFDLSELQARADALVRKRTAHALAKTTLTCGDLTMDLLSRHVVRGERAIDLLAREFKLLEFLLRHKGQVVTRTMLLESVWDYQSDPHTNIIDTHVSRLRKKLDEGFDSPLLHTIRGIGYRLSPDP
jgi:two-component system OmpR family response regulator